HHRRLLEVGCERRAVGEFQVVVDVLPDRDVEGRARLCQHERVEVDPARQDDRAVEDEPVPLVYARARILGRNVVRVVREPLGVALGEPESVAGREREPRRGLDRGVDDQEVLAVHAARLMLNYLVDSPERPDAAATRSARQRGVDVALAQQVHAARVEVAYGHDGLEREALLYAGGELYAVRFLQVRREVDYLTRLSLKQGRGRDVREETEQRRVHDHEPRLVTAAPVIGL